MTFGFTPAERTALASLYTAHAAGGAAPVKYAACVGAKYHTPELAALFAKKARERR